MATNPPTTPFNCYLSRDSILYPFHPDYIYHCQKGRRDVVMITGGEALALYLTPAMVNSLGKITNRRLFKDAQINHPTRHDRNKAIEVYTEETVETIHILLKVAQGDLRSYTFRWFEITDCLRFCIKAGLDKGILDAIMDDAIPNLHAYDLFPALVFFSRRNFPSGARRVLRQGWRAEVPVLGRRVVKPLRPNKEGQEWAGAELRRFPAHWFLALTDAEREAQAQSGRPKRRLYWEIFSRSFRHHLTRRWASTGEAESSHFNSS